MSCPRFPRVRLSGRQFMKIILVSNVRIEKYALRVSAEEAFVDLGRHVEIAVPSRTDKSEIKITALRIVVCVSQSRGHQSPRTLLRGAMKRPPSGSFQSGFSLPEVDDTAHGSGPIPSTGANIVALVLPRILMLSLHQCKWPDFRPAISTRLRSGFYDRAGLRSRRAAGG